MTRRKTPQEPKLVLDDSPANPPKFSRCAPRRNEVFQFVGSEVAAGRPFPTILAIGQHTGRTMINDALVSLRQQGMVARYIVLASGIWRYAWRLTPRGLASWRETYERPETKYPPVSVGAGNSVGVTESPASSSKTKRKASAAKARKTRRTGAPKRVPHKPTTPHKKPSRQQRRETERNREQHVTA